MRGPRQAKTGNSLDPLWEAPGRENCTQPYSASMEIISAVWTLTSELRGSLVFKSEMKEVMVVSGGGKAAVFGRVRGL